LAGTSGDKQAASHAIAACDKAASVPLDVEAAAWPRLPPTHGPKFLRAPVDHQGESLIPPHSTAARGR
jgi:hypothetical protein